MQHERQHYVNGAWVEPLEPHLVDVIDPSTEEAITKIAVGGAKDVDRAVAAAQAAFQHSPARLRRSVSSFCAPSWRSAPSAVKTSPQ